MALAMELDLVLHQLDITTAFLKKRSDEQIFMEVPDFLKEALMEMFHFKGFVNKTKEEITHVDQQIKKKNKFEASRSTLKNKTGQEVKNFGLRRLEYDLRVYTTKSGKD